MIGRLLFGPKQLVEGRSIYVPGRVLNIDLIRDLDEQLQADVKPVLVSVRTIANGSIRGVRTSELASLSGNERLGLMIEGDGPEGRVFVLPVGLTGGLVASFTDESYRPALQRAIDTLTARSRPIFRWRRLLALAPASLAVMAVAFWAVLLATQSQPWPAIVSGSAALLLVAIGALRFSWEGVRKLDRSPLPHRFDPISYREIAADRANRHRDLRVVVLTALGAVVVAVILWLVGIKP